jgi:hypothetical protein
MATGLGRTAAVSRVATGLSEGNLRSRRFAYCTCSSKAGRSTPRARGCGAALDVVTEGGDGKEEEATAAGEDAREGGDEDAPAWG